MPNRKSLALAAVLSLAGAATAEAAYFTQGEFRSALGSLNSHLDDMPAQTIVITDLFGSYTPATRLEPVNTGSIFNPFGGQNPAIVNGRRLTPASTAAGQIGGNFECSSPIYGCLGAHTITYTLPYEIVGLAGTLDYRCGFRPCFYDVIPFLDVPPPAVLTLENAGGYTGFWGTTFAPTSTLTVVWSPGLRGADNFASFLLTDAQVVRAVRVPEPGTLALLGTALLGLLAVRRKAA
jgi:hypothetical protein